MFEMDDDPQQPTLSDRLQEAAAARAIVRGDVLDEVMLDAQGVLDLRREAQRAGSHATGLPSALATVTSADGADTGGVAELFADPDDASLWERSRRLLGAGSAAAPALSSTPLAGETTDGPDAGPSSVDVDHHGDVEDDDVEDDGETVIVEAPSAEPVEIDLTDPLEDEARPTADCPNCGGTGRRDLFDRFSRTGYFSCDECSVMWQEPTDL